MAATVATTKVTTTTKPTTKPTTTTKSTTKPTATTTKLIVTTTLKCPTNEMWSATLAGCQKTCANQNATISCTPKAGCVCINGYIRRSTVDPTCIPVKNCLGDF